MAVRLLEGPKDLIEFSAKATVAVTGNPTAGTTGGGLFVTLDTDPNYFVLSSAGDDADGIVPSNYLINGQATIKAHGIRPIKLGGTVAAKGYVECGAAGVAVAWGGLNPCKGQVIQAGVSGDFVDLIYGKRPSIAVGVSPASAMAVNGAIAVAPATIVITKGSILAATLAAPTAVTHDGYVIRVISSTAFAHTVTTPSNKINGNKAVATFGGAIGDGLTLTALGGVWYSSAMTNITLS